MPLFPNFDLPTVGTETGQAASAKDDNGNRVVVEATHEVIQDFGWDKVWPAAGSKYDVGDIQYQGPPPKIVVGRSDFV